MVGEIFSSVMFKNQLPPNCKITEIVYAAKKQFLEKDIDCIQPINGLIRFDFLKRETRLAFLQKGLKIGSRTIIPMEWVDSMDTPQVKLTIDGLTRSTSDEALIAALVDIGAEPTSLVQPAFYWDHERNCPSNIKSGRRYVHIKKPSSPLPFTFPVGDKEAHLKYFGQTPPNKNGNSLLKHGVQIQQKPLDHTPQTSSNSSLNANDTHTKNPILSQKLPDGDDDDVIPSSLQVAPIFTKPPKPSRTSRSQSRGRPTERSTSKRRNSSKRGPSSESVDSPSKRPYPGTYSQVSTHTNSPLKIHHDYYEGLPNENNESGS